MALLVVPKNLTVAAVATMGGNVVLEPLGHQRMTLNQRCSYQLDVVFRYIYLPCYFALVALLFALHATPYYDGESTSI